MSNFRHYRLGGNLNHFYDIKTKLEQNRNKFDIYENNWNVVISGGK